MNGFFYEQHFADNALCHSSANDIDMSVVENVNSNDLDDDGWNSDDKEESAEKSSGG